MSRDTLITWQVRELRELCDVVKGSHGAHSCRSRSPADDPNRASPDSGRQGPNVRGVTLPPLSVPALGRSMPAAPTGTVARADMVYDALGFHASLLGQGLPGVRFPSLEAS